MHIIYDNFFLKHHTGNFHPENAGRLVAIKKYLDRSRLFKKIVFTDPSAATAGQVCMVHEREYVAKVRKLSESGLIYYLDADTVVSPDTYNCAMLAAGGCLNGIDFLLRKKKT